MSTKDDHFFRFETVAVVFHRNDCIQVLQPFIYADSTTQQPVVLPPLEPELSLIPPGARAAGLALGALVMLTSLGWFTWTMTNRKRDVVRASQPIFLGQLCLGTFVMASAIIPQSLQSL